MEGKRILVVDDEPQITRVLRRSLAAHRYDVRVAADGESALDTLRDFHPDLIITDLSMPEMSGIELCQKIRKTSKIPIIVLSVKGEEKTKVAALDAGADDYITKPFGMDELLARVRAAFRRFSSNEENKSSVLTAGDFEIDIDAHKVSVARREVSLTPKEFDLLFYLVQNRGRVITHHNLLGAIWGGNFTKQTEYLRVFVGQLRKKIEPQPNQPKYILTVPWVGYRFNTGEE
ncbi:MAG: response regulator transcription factor [Acidobacteriota bacterium]|jgi:two-component system KDP operon response regulator KdpE|nr:response regulator transcription factor [Acidobacteriota bacterium]MDQ3374375.1 response regulator transcription factor [Acidobacteriota bacterium]